MNSKNQSFAPLSVLGSVTVAALENSSDDDEATQDNTIDRQEEKTADLLKTKYLPSIVVQEHINKLWSNESVILDLLYGTVVGYGPQKKRVSNPDMFFITALCVPPNRFRPLSKLGQDQIFEHPQNTYLASVLKSNQIIKTIQEEIDGISTPTFVSSLEDKNNRLVNNCVLLQQNVNNFIDSSGAPTPGGKPAAPGIRQLLEKKEGLFRKHMMGKRVNYAARSVISPDPNIETNEIGVVLFLG